MKKVAFIPARSGSKRIPHKNIKLLNNHPLIAYAIRSALDSKIFNDVICITDSEEYAEIALHYGASVPFLRPEGISKDASPDISITREPGFAICTPIEDGKPYTIFPSPPDVIQ